MSDTVTLRMGDKGRVVIPAELRARRHWDAGTTLIAVEQPTGVLLMTREDALDRIRTQLAGTDVVQELLDEHRSIAAREDAGES